MIFHRHRWRESRRYFVPPRLSGKSELETPDYKSFDHLVNGYTVVELRCEDCGDVAHRTLPGDAHTAATLVEASGLLKDPR